MQKVIRLLVLTAICAAAEAYAQSVTATILGTVTDSTGALVPGAKVRVVNQGTSETREADTAEQGSFYFAGLPVGEYQVEVKRDGFKTSVRSGIRLEVNRNARVDFALEVGQVSEQMQVTADVPLVDTSQAQYGSVVDTKKAEDLPLAGRNIYGLASILPGVQSAETETVYTRDGSTIEVNGSRSKHSTFLLDGGLNNSHFRNAGNASPNPDAIQEFRVITSNYNAEFGRSSGAVVNVITKSGTNQFHGTLFHFLRNNKLNARNFFQNEVPPLKYNQFGGTLGGPVRRNQTFFFGSYEGLKIRATGFQNGALPPTAAERTGNFSAAAANLRPLDPLTTQPFPGGIIPQSRLDPVALRITRDWLPLPNTPDGRLVSERPAPSDQHQYLGKVDHNFNNNHRLSGSLFWVNNSFLTPFDGSNIPDYSAWNSQYDQQNATAEHTWILSPNLLNSARFIYTRLRFGKEPPSRVSWADWGANVPLAADFHKPYLPNIVVTGRFNMGFANDLRNQRDDTLGFNNTLSWTRGSHAIKAGVWLSYERYDLITSLAGAGLARTGGEATRNPMSDFLLGRMATFRQTNGSFREFRRWDLEPFIQDDWKVTRWLTLNLGLRYELYPRWYSLRNDLQTYRPGAQSTVIPGALPGLLFEGDPGIGRYIQPLDKNNFAPRFGFVLDPFRNGRTAIRGGYGIFYSMVYADNSTYMQQQPFQIDYTVFGTTSLVDPYATVGGSPFPIKLNPQAPLFVTPASVSWLDPAFATPYVQQFSLGIQHQVVRDLSVQAAYVGNLSRKMTMQVDANQPIFRAGATTGNINARRPVLPGTFGQINWLQSSGNASYHSLQVTVDKRFARGFSILGAYTFGKSIDEASDDPTNPTQVLLVDSFNRRYDRGVAAGDVRHMLNLTYIWQLPQAPPSFGWIGRQVLGGWQMNGTMRIHSGSAFNVTAGRDVNLNGVNNDRPNLVDNPRLDASRPRAERITAYFRTSAFANPANGTLGTAGRNILYGPGAFNWAHSFFKEFGIREGHRLQLRGEFFNFPNTVNLSNPNALQNSPNFGRILGAGAPRTVQIALKYRF